MKNRRWISALIGGFGVRAGEVGAKFALYMLAARLMTAGECGLLFLCMSWGALAATAARLGVDRALSRLIAAELAVEQGRRALAVLCQGAAIAVASGLLLGGLTFAAAPLAAGLVFHQPAAADSLRAAALLIPALSLAVTLDFALIGFARTSMSQILQNLFWPVAMLAALLLGVRSAPLMLMVMAASQMAAIVAAAALIGMDRRIGADRPSEHAPLPSLWRTARPLFVVELVQMSLVSLPTLLLGAFADPEAVGIFSIAQRASMLVLVVLLSVSVLAAPRFSEFHRLGDWDGLASLNRRTQLAGLLFGGGLCLCLAALARTFLSLLGAGYEAGRSTLLILLAGQAVNALYAAQDYMLMMTGQGAALQLINLGQFLLIAFLGAALIPSLGATGAALATAAATAFGAIGTATTVRALYPRATPYLTFDPPDKLTAFMQRRAT